MATRSDSTARSGARLLPALSLFTASAALLTACGTSSSTATPAGGTSTTGAAAATTAGAATSAAAAGSSAAAGSTSGTAATSAAAGGKPVTLTWWHNATADPGKSYFQSVADAYTKAHPNVTFKIQPIQNEQLDTKLSLGLESNSPPDIIQSNGGGKLRAFVNAGKIQDITAATKSWISTIGATGAGWTNDGKVYGIPFSLGVVGFWYNKDQFTKAGITTPPATWTDLLADIGKLKAAGETPIAVGAKDKWPNAFYWDYLAVRECSKEVLTKAADTLKIDDPCWTRAGTDLKQLVGAKPFQTGFLGTPAQTGAGSSAGLIANDKAAMELQGHWDPGVMQGLTSNKNFATNLGWFPFPDIAGSAGVPGAALGGGDGFSCSVKAPPECASFLQFLMSKANQTQLGVTGFGLPTVIGAETGIKDQNLANLLKFRNTAPFVQLYLDTTFGVDVGNALNDAVTGLLAGSVKPEGVAKAVSDAAASQ
ncbi:MAG: raffinose/stachyose/melibiose transport system substrate-binding protein [Frankiales bacterium]|nr:raffinose/stachyose/melibiose transport system substrate-binding protein [Frankiales bacterium]